MQHAQLFRPEHSLREDDLGLALAAEHLPRRGHSFAVRLRAQKAKPGAAQDRKDVVDINGVSF